jgi:hypothetical protein
MCFSFRIIATSLKNAEITVKLGYNVMKGLNNSYRYNRGVPCYGCQELVAATEYLQL